MHIKALYDKITKIGKDLIWKDELKHALEHTSAWHGKFGDKSDLVKLLHSLPNNRDNGIDKTAILCLGLLWCDGSPKDKTDVLLKMMAPPLKKGEKKAVEKKKEGDETEEEKDEMI